MTARSDELMEGALRKCSNVFELPVAVVAQRSVGRNPPWVEV